VGKASTETVGQAQRPLPIAAVDQSADEMPAQSPPQAAFKTEVPVPEAKTESEKPQPSTA
jgi:hypothetical protein